MEASPSDPGLDLEEEEPELLSHMQSIVFLIQPLGVFKKATD